MRWFIFSVQTLSLPLGLVAVPTFSGRYGLGAAPLAHLQNGTYSGVHSPEYNQDFFLGLPFAQPPVGELRFRNPRPLDTSWSGVQQATEYSAECVGYGSSQMGYNVSEDCLYLNVIRPSGRDLHEKLPVLAWIYGGGFVQGGAPDLRYNMSFIVQHSVDIGQPILAVSINYRLSAWGFLSSNEVLAQGESNFGIRDQRLALQWVQENIASFGGDPTKVTIWGQSAGAMSVGLHLTAYNGRDDGLFRSAIMDSGGPVFSSAQNRSTERSYQNLTQQTGCGNAGDKLQCLRALPYEQLNNVVNTSSLSGAFGPRIDGDIIFSHSSLQLSAGRFVHVPIIIGTNSDEGTSFSPTGLNTTQDWLNALNASRIPSEFAQQILQAYADDTSVEILQNLPPNYELGPPLGAEYRRAATYYGDATFIAGRRLACETWAAAGLPAYSYRFNAIPAWSHQEQGATHFVEVAFAMLNLQGVGYPPVRIPPFQGKPESYKDLARLMSGHYVSFVASFDPNAWRSGSNAGPFSAVAPWPAYSLTNPQNFVYDANVTSHLESDTWRAAGINLINSGNLAVYDR
ncbi:hypothetical protein PV08_11034 [Exophiala spinifera]|uniref:Carboxylic ester hydrolase n=1 Tax=Exophiala spinifera TaxID=91928 RepID=A0A0D2BFG3_9EURO|nr:uncharacterized protein PV08_11034 [Exophiala spinifera]KIW10074.1 hypothetical protein PV08_11034 [Exophiala spinifera]